jgi:hypothetical protein
MKAMHRKVRHISVATWGAILAIVAIDRFVHLPLTAMLVLVISALVTVIALLV